MKKYILILMGMLCVVARYVQYTGKRRECHYRTCDSKRLRRRPALCYGVDGSKLEMAQ